MTTAKPVSKSRTPARRRATKRTTTTARAAKPTPQAAVVEEAVGAAAAAASRNPKQKLVRDSFTIPKAEYAVLLGLKLRAADLKRPTKKSELLRAGVAALHALSDTAFLSILNSVPSLKTGRPKAAHDNGKPAKGGAALE